MMSGSVLVTDGGRGASRSALATVRALATAGRSVTVTRSSARELAESSRHTSDSVVVPPAADTDAYREAIRALMRSGRHTHCFATSDDALFALDPVAAALVDKQKLHAKLLALGIATPSSRVFSSIEDVVDAGISAPIVIKPVSGSIPAMRADDSTLHEDLAAFAGPVVVQPFLSGTLEAVAGVVIDGQLLAAVHQSYIRTWPVACGTASAAITVEPDENREAQLLALLDGHSGIFQAQYVGGALIDINPRPYGSMPLALRAGVNLPAIVCDHTGSRGAAQPIQRARAIQRARVGVRYRWIEGDVRNLLSSVQGGSIGLMGAMLALRPHRGTAHSVVSMRDPMPTLARGGAMVRSRSPRRTP